MNIPILNLDSFQVIDIAKKAGDAIMEIIYKRDFEIYEKNDNSLLTEADLESHELANLLVD